MLSGKALNFLIISLSALQLSRMEHCTVSAFMLWQSQNWHWCPANDTRTAEDKSVVFANLGEVTSLSSLRSTCKNTGHITVLWLLIHLHDNDKLSTLRASSAFSTGMSLMAAFSSFLTLLLLACFSTSSKEPKETVMEAGKLISQGLGSLPLRPAMAARKLCGNTQCQTSGSMHAAPRPIVQRAHPDMEPSQATYKFGSLQLLRQAACYSMVCINTHLLVFQQSFNFAFWVPS